MIAASEELSKSLSQWAMLDSTEKASASSTSYEIPKAWKTANEALQGVVQQQPPKSENVATTNSTAPAVQQSGQVGPVNYSYPQYPSWPQQQMYYGYPNMAYPGYFNYNMNTYGNYGGFYGQSMPVAADNMMMNPRMMGNQLLPNENVPENKQLAVNQAVNMLASQPPPPPPATPPEEVKQDQFIARNNQAPGIPNAIRFSLPKPKIQNKMNNRGNFQNNRGPKNMNYGQGKQNFSNRLSHPGSSATPKYNNETSGLGRKEDERHKQLDVNNGNWPPSLRQYIEDAFSKCKSGIDKDQVEIILKGKLSQSYNEKTLWEKDWSKEPLPNIHSERIEKELDDGYIPLKVGSAIKHPKKYGKSSSGKNMSRPRSRSRSKSRSSSPHSRRVIRRKRYSGDSSSSMSSNSSPNPKKRSPGSYVSSTIGEQQHNNSKWNTPSARRRNKKSKRKQDKLQSAFSLEPEFGTDEHLQRRAARFETAAGKKGGSLYRTISNPLAIDDSVGIDWSSCPVVGTCEDIAKPFLRITSAVEPSTIRPVHLLVKALQMVKEHWVTNQDYDFVCDQLKSIRQDLVVQCVQDKFTIQAYETHARIALEKGDRTEFNQCQSQLRVLYEEVKDGNQFEFMAYRILYNIYSRETREINYIIATLSAEEKKDDQIRHAIAVNRAWTLNNFHIFFKLYRVAPKMSGFIMDWFLKRERVAAVKILTKSYRQSLPVAFVVTELGFPSEMECLLFLEEVKCILSDDKSSILCKESMNVVTS